ncbi:MAG: serine/threonine protein kinase [Mogibacterium sp.]|nr:serine/threonine protein kinase [Mogibacterium sp.]
MDNLRLRWDNFFLKKVKYEIIMKIVCAAVCGAGVFRMLSFYSKLGEVPLPGLVEGQLVILISLGCAALTLLSPGLGVALSGAALFITIGGTAPILVTVAAVLMIFEGVISKSVHCLILMLIPLCMMTSKEGSPAAAYLLFTLIVFCGHKMSSSPKYTAAVVFSIMGFVSGIYIANEEPLSIWNQQGMSMKSNLENVIAGIDLGFGATQAGSMLLPLIVVIAVNLIIAIIAGRLLISENVKITRIPLDIREGVIFALMAALLTGSGPLLNLVDGLTVNISVVQVLIQTILAYVITRPFSSFKVSNAMSQADLEANTGQLIISAIDVERNFSEEIEAIAGTLSSEKSYSKVIFTGKKPVKTILLYGNAEMNKQYVVENLSSSLSQEIEYLDASDLMRRMADSGEIELKCDSNKPTCFFINHFDSLFGSDPGKKTAQKLMDFISNTADDRNAMFILAADNPSEVPDDCFGENGISRVIHAGIGDSIIYNDTYAVLDVIGKGGFGEVFSAWHTRLNEKVVLKKVAADQKTSVSGKREVELLKRVKHMYLPKIYDVFDADQALYLVTDFVPGKSFADYLKEGRRFEQKYVLIWAKQLSDAVRYLHNMQPAIVHSDIKPGNIMLTPDGNICLIDFNISAIIDKGTVKSVGTTPGYSPIEQYGFVKNYLNLLQKRGVDVEAFSKAKVESGYLSSKLSDELSRSLLNSANTSPPAVSPVQNNLDKALSGDMWSEEWDEPTVAGDWDEATVAAEWDDETSAIPDEQTLPQDQLDLVVDNRSFLIDCIQKGYGPRSDIYAIGATLYHLLTGVRPSLNFFAIKPAHEYHNDISSDFAAVIEKCMRIDPDERYQDIEELCKALEAVRL